jgi:hypothetical protein
VALLALSERMLSSLPPVEAATAPADGMTLAMAPAGGAALDRVVARPELIRLIQAMEEAARQGTGHRAACDQDGLQATLDFWQGSFLPRVGCPWPGLRRWLRPQPDRAALTAAEAVVSGCGLDLVIAATNPKDAAWTATLRAGAVARMAAAITSVRGSPARFAGFRLLSGLPTRGWLLRWALLGALTALGVAARWLDGWGVVLALEIALWMLWSRGGDAWGVGVAGLRLREAVEAEPRPRLDSELVHRLSFEVLTDLTVIVYQIFFGLEPADGGGGEGRTVPLPLRSSRWNRMPRTAWAGSPA